MIGSPGEIALAVIKSLIMIIAVSHACHGYPDVRDPNKFFNIPRTHPLVRGLLFGIGVVMVPKDSLLNGLGILAFLVLFSDFILDKLRHFWQRPIPKP